MTREEILEIDQYCQEHKMSYRKRLDELHIPFWNFYKAKRKYRLEDESSTSRGEFVQLGPGTFSSGMMPVRNGTTVDAMFSSLYAPSGMAPPDLSRDE